METTNISNEILIPERKFELDAKNISLISSINKWTFVLSIIGFVLFALFVSLLIIFINSGGQWSIQSHRGFEWTDLIEVILLILFLVSIISLLMFSRRMGKLGKQISAISESGLLIRNSFLSLRNHFKFIGITSILIIAILLYGIIVFLL